jgi:molybdopterin-guanine dinucleotide biosynthesis protein B
MPETLPGIPVPVVGFAAYSGTGKTTLLTRVIPVLTERRLRVGLVKHTHHKFDIDYPGKDSYRLRKAGASQVLLGSSQRWALMEEHEVKGDRPLEFHVRHLDLDNLDVVLVEGFKTAPIPKIEVYRPSLNNPPLYLEDLHIIAIATDEPEVVETDLPVFGLDEPRAVADFIVDRFLDNIVLLKRTKLNKEP